MVFFSEEAMDPDGNLLDVMEIIG